MMCQDLMKTDLITVQTDTDALSVASVMAKYNLLAVPVVSKEGILEGIVTVDETHRIGEDNAGLDCWDDPVADSRDELRLVEPTASLAQRGRDQWMPG